MRCCAALEIVPLTGIAPAWRVPTAAEGESELSGEDAANPADEFAAGVAAEVGELAMRLEKSFLDDVVGIELAPQTRADLSAGDEREIAGEAVKEDVDGGWVAAARILEQTVEIGTGGGDGGKSAHESPWTGNLHAAKCGNLRLRWDELVLLTK